MISTDTNNHIDSSEERSHSETQNDNGFLFNFTQIWLQITSNNLLNDGNEDNGTTDNGMKDTINRREPIIILGKTYNDTNLDDNRIEEDISSRIWLTYRTGFEPIPKTNGGPQPLSFVHSMIFNRNPFSSTFNNFHSLIDNDNFTTDVGWGCMIRTSQSLLANALQSLILGRDFKYGTVGDNAKHNEIIDMFKDGPKAPFSLHNFIRVASELPLQVKPGQWFGPNAASLSIKRLCTNVYRNNQHAKVQVLISESSDLYDDKINLIFKDIESRPDALLLLLPVRLGINKVNPLYHASILQLLSLKQSVGIAGGKPSSSYYFFGYQNNSLLYLDPHYPQFISSRLSIYDTYHTNRYQMLNVDDMDPSMMVGLLVKDIEDYQEFKLRCTEMNNKIVHFHPNSKTLDSRNSMSDFKRKHSEFVCIDAEDLQRREEFININNDHDEDPTNTEDFVDVGNEIDKANDFDRNVGDSIDTDDPINILNSDSLEHDS